MVKFFGMTPWSCDVFFFAKDPGSIQLARQAEVGMMPLLTLARMLGSRTKT